MARRRDVDAGTQGAAGTADVLLDRWLAHRQGEPETPEPPESAETAEPVESEVLVESVEPVEPVEPEPVEVAPARVRGPRLRRRPVRVEVEPDPEPVDEPVDVAVEEPGDEPEAPAERRPRPRATPEPGPSADVEFKPRRTARRALGLALLVMLAATVAAGLAVREQPDTESLILLGSLAGITLVTWAVRAGSVPTTLRVSGGQLHVQRGGQKSGQHRTYDLASPYTPVAEVGRPGRRGWKVVIGNARGGHAFTVDASLVDPRAFTEVLRRYRPE